MSPTNRLTKTKGPRPNAAVEPGQANPGNVTPKPRKSGGGELLANRPEMAGKLGYSVRTLDRLTVAKVIPHIRCGRLIRYRVDAVMAALQRNCEVREVSV